MLLSEQLYLTASAFADMSEMEFMTACECHQHTAAWDYRARAAATAFLCDPLLLSRDTGHVISTPITQDQLLQNRGFVQEKTKFYMSYRDLYLYLPYLYRDREICVRMTPGESSSAIQGPILQPRIM